MQRINYHKLHGKSKEKRKSKKILIIFLIICTLGTSIILIKKGNNKDKNIKIGNNSSSQEIVEYILNISSYEAQIDVEVKSNKNSNKYKLKQKYINSQNNEQEVLEPSNIQGVKIIRENDKLKIETSGVFSCKVRKGVRMGKENREVKSSVLVDLIYEDEFAEVKRCRII